MKRLLLILCVLFTFKPVVHAQCTPDSKIDKAFMYPPALSEAMVGYYYYQTVTFRIPADTDIVYNSIPVHAVVDSAAVINIGGIPAGYSYACTPAKCRWPGGSLGCAQILGITNMNDSARVGSYPIKMYMQFWFKALGTSYVIVDSSSSFTFKIVSYNGQFEIAKTQPLSVYPNPSNGNFKIEMKDIHTNNNLLEVYSLEGKKVFEKQFDKPAQFLTTEEVNLNSDNKGIYLVRMISGNQVYQQKIVVQ